MNDKAAIGIILVAVVGFYFLAPVVYWFSFYRATPPTRAESVFSVYRPLSCETFGVGVALTSYGHLYLTCTPLIPTGATAERVVVP